MKGWCKILELEEYDVLVQRLVTKEDGEHVKITVRFADGQFIKSASLGDGQSAEKLAIELFDQYKKKDAYSFVEELNKLKIDNDQQEEEDDQED